MKPAGNVLNFPIKKTNPNKIVRPVPKTHHSKPAALEHANKRYRVRDRDWVKVYGDGLTHDAAVALLAKVTGSGKSRTARIEDMAVQRPSDAQLATARAEHAAEDLKKRKHR